MSISKGGVARSYLFKVILIGDGAVGKTSLIHRYMEGKFKADYLPTIGSQIYIKNLVGEGGTEIRLVIWDISGQPAFGRVRADYYKGAMGILLVFDLTRPETLEHLDRWINETKRYAQHPEVVVLGNKADLEHERKILPQSGRGYASKVRGSYFETSAKDGRSVEQAFSTLGDKLLKSVNQTV